MDKTRVRTARSVVNLRKGRNDWYRIENRAGGVTAVYIYDEIGWFGVTARDFVKELQAVTAGSIDLHINSPGGDVFDGIAIFNAVRNHPAPVISFIDGLAASAASFIAMAGDEVVIARNATMMIHDAHGLCIGDATDMTEMADLLDKSSDNIADIYVQKAGGTVEHWRDAMRATTWYSSDEAVAAGLADRVGGKTDDDDPENSWDLSVFDRAPRPAPAPPAPVAPPVPDPAPVFVFDPEVFRNAMREAAK